MSENLKKIIGIVIFFTLGSLLWSNHRDMPAPSPIQIARQSVWTSTHDMTSNQNAAHHFAKHGAEMGYKKAADYEAAAVEFTDHPPKGTLQTTQTDGDTVFFDPQSGVFAIRTHDGYLRSFFKRNDSLRGSKSNMEYFNEQAGRR